MTSAIAQPDTTLSSTTESPTSLATSVVEPLSPSLSPPPPSTKAAAVPPPSPIPTAATVTGGRPCGHGAGETTRYEHVIWVWMENKDSAELSSASSAPFLASVGAGCASAANFVDHGLHPSLPNYIAATAGDPLGVVDDGPPASHQLVADNLFRQVRTAGHRAVSYQESMTGNCALTSTELYAVKHNPAAYYVDPDDRAACRTDNVPFDQFAVDLAAGELPAFALISPNICNDMHDCPVATGDRWLEQLVTAITDSPTYAAGRTIVFITFDESEGAGTMPFYAISPGIVPGTRPDVELDHYSLLAFTEDALGIVERLGNAAHATDLAGALGLRAG